MSCYLDGYYLILRKEGDQTAVILAEGSWTEPDGQQQLYSSESEELARVFASGVSFAIRLRVVDEVIVRNPEEDLAFQQGQDAAALIRYLARRHLTPGGEEALRVARREEAPRQRRAPYKRVGRGSSARG